MKLPQQDLELIETLKTELANLDNELIEDIFALIDIITRQQLALDRAIEQRNLYVEGEFPWESEATKNEHNKELADILDGAK